MTRVMKRGLGIGLAMIVAAATLTFASSGPPKPAQSTTQKIQRRPPTPILYTDLAITSLGTDIRTCRIQVTWTNKGTAKIDATVTQRVEILTPPQQVVTTNHVVLDPGASFTYKADPSLVIRGAQQALAWIDVDNVLGETQTRRANNSVTRTLTCGRAQPDLYPSNVTFQVKSTTTDTQGHTCKVLRAKPVILNIGTAAVSTPFKVKVEADSGTGRSWVAYYEPTVASMTVGQSLTLPGFEIDTCFWFVHNPQMPPNDLRRFRLTVDSGGQVHESSEDNNQNQFHY